MRLLIFLFFFFNDTATTEIYTLSLHDALPISGRLLQRQHLLTLVDEAAGDIDTRTAPGNRPFDAFCRVGRDRAEDRKSTRLNSSHANISYAVFCLKKKKHKTTI